MKYLWKNVLDMPPSWLTLFLVITYFQSRIFNPFGFDSSLTVWLGWGLIAVGLVLMLWAATEFLRHKTSVVPRRVPDALIARGPYRWTRNPIYLADATVFLGFALLRGSIIGVLLVPVFMKLIEVRFIRGEERRLAAEFPEAFAKFSARTRRWL